MIKILAAIPIAGAVVADDAPALPNWAQYGLLGLIILGFVVRQLVPGWLYQDIKEENKLIKDENTRLVQLVLETQQKTIPAMEAATRASETAAKTVEEAMAEIRILKRGA